MTDIDLQHLFTYHEPQEGYERLRSAALTFARVIPAGPDRTAAIREAVMTANAGIATGGGFYRSDIRMSHAHESGTPGGRELPDHRGADGQVS